MRKLDSALDVGLVHRTQRPELGDGGLVRAEPHADGRDEALGSPLL